ncbi:MAG: glycosyltransferase family 39 protein [Thermoleophilia bacterium]
MLLPAIVVAAVLIRIIGIDSNSLWFDELYNVWVHKLSFRETINESIAAGHPPLYDLVNRIWLSIGESELWVRLLPCIAGTGVVVLTYLSANELFSRTVGLWAAALAAFAPFLVWYSRTANYYSFITLVSMLSFYALVRACKRGGWWDWAAYAGATTLVLFTYFFGAILWVAGVFVLVLLRDKKERWRAPWFASTAFLFVGAAVTYLISRQSTVESSSLDPPPLGEWINVVKMVVVSPFILVSGYVDRIYVFNGQGSVSLARGLVLLLVAAGLLALLVSKKTRPILAERKLLALSLYTFILIVGPTSAQFISGGLPDERFLVWATPTFFMIPAVLLSRIPRRAYLTGGGLLLAMLLCFSIWQNLMIIKGPNWRYIMSKIDSQRQDSDMLVCFPIHECELAADYYLPDPLPVAGGMPSYRGDSVYFLPAGTSWGGYKSGYWGDQGAEPALAGEELEARLDSDLSQADRLWLVISNRPNYERHPSIQEAIDKNWRQIDEFDERQFVVRLFIRK